MGRQEVVGGREQRAGDRKGPETRNPLPLIRSPLDVSLASIASQTVPSPEAMSYGRHIAI